MTQRIEHFWVWLKELNLFWIWLKDLNLSFWSQSTQSIFFWKNHSKNFFKKRKWLKELNHLFNKYLFFWQKMIHRFEPFFSTRLKELNPLKIWLTELNPFSFQKKKHKNESMNWTFFEYDAKNRTLFQKWPLELNLFFFKNLFFDMTHRIELIFSNMTERIDFFQYDSKNWFLTMIQRIQCLKKNIDTKTWAFFLNYDAKNWTFPTWLKELNLLSNSLNQRFALCFFFNLTQRVEILSIWLKELNFFKWWLKELNFLMTERIERFFFRCDSKEMNRFSFFFFQKIIWL